MTSTEEKLFEWVLVGRRAMLVMDFQGIEHVQAGAPQITLTDKPDAIQETPIHSGTSVSPHGSFYSSRFLINLIILHLNGSGARHS